MSEFKLKSRAFLKSPDRKRHFNRELFSAIAREYSGMSRVLSFGRDLAWKRRLVDMLPAMDAPRCLDLACGPGDLVEFVLQRYPQASVTGVDLTAPMLELARQRFESDERAQFVEGDMAATGFSAAGFDLITVGYGIRNAPDLDNALGEIARLLKPGGIVATLDFSRWEGRWMSTLELGVLRLWCGWWGLVRSGNADTYGYIADSLARFPARKQLHRKFSDHSLEILRSRLYFCGVLEAIVAQKADGSQHG